MIKDKYSQYIRTIELKRKEIDDFECYPYNLNAVKYLNEISMHPNVTFFVGENGSGKSTLLEAIAVSFGFNPEGGTKNFNFSTYESHSDLYRYLKIIKGLKHPKDGFFLRAESFYNVASNIEQLDSEGIGARVIDSYGGVSLHKQSHGESFMSVFLNRLNGKGIYIFDEPEAALSPNRQLAFLSRMHHLVEEDAQFIIATHSPIIMSYPNSKIINLDDKMKEIKYEKTEHYLITRDFLNNTEKMLHLLME
ncbi:AAA family ATPase [Clostridium oceanicum]|uniref:AAA family ATPase n=1 Tax=Clostridium oceanicum TaxID=1543 RepID=A0ABN1JD86_9CLOT